MLHVRLTCNHKDCDESFEVSHADKHRARREARAAGWLPTRESSGGQMIDLCPEHRTDQS